MTKIFDLAAKVWLYPGKAAWHFVTVPSELAEEIDDLFSHAKGGWGSLRVTVTVGDSNWMTSIFPDKKTKTYFLPIKKEVRNKELIHVGDTISLSLEIKD